MSKLVNFSVFFACFVVYVSSQPLRKYFSDEGVEIQHVSEDDGQEVVEHDGNEDGLSENVYGWQYLNWGRKESEVFGGNINNSYPYRYEDKAAEDYDKSFEREMREQVDTHIKNKLGVIAKEKVQEKEEEEEDCNCCCTMM
ncbi:unnamed protein product [Meloidogyne enterolobii]|uniref:Uncharacterized protein n=1 Tax=Meloidogyne enterolobii TaxID=390850 RepID=A0ACB0ZM58_MELEN